MKNFFIILFLMIMIAHLYAQDVTYNDVFTQFEQMYGTIIDYQCRMRLTSYNGNSCEIRINNYYFKKPENIRMDILEGTRFLDKGRIGVYKGGNTVAGRLGICAITVKKTNPQVTTNRGYTFDESDMHHILEKFRYHLSYSDISLLIEDNTFTLVMIPLDPETNKGITKDIIILDIKTLLPLQAESYVASKLIQSVEWSHYIVNAGLPDKIFNVWYDPGNLKKSGIKTIHGIPFTQ